MPDLTHADRPGRRKIEVYNSVGGGAFFQRLLAEWRGAGDEVSLIQALSEQDYRAEAGRLARLHRRWRMYGGHAWASLRFARRRSPAGEQRIRVVASNPFFAPALVAGAAREGQTINLLFDLYPEALVQAGTTSADSGLARLCAAVTRQALQRCDATVFLGQRLRHHTEKAHGAARRGVVIPVGADGIPFRACPPEPLVRGDAPLILYAGQMGHMHETETIRQFWMRGSLPALRWQFFAGGPRLAALRGCPAAPSATVWGRNLADAPWQQTMKASHIALVTIAPGAEKVVMPSKTYSALVAGQAILAVCRRDSDLADLIERHDCGWVVPPGDVEALGRTLRRIVDNPQELWHKRQRAYLVGHAEYDMLPVARQWQALFAELENSARDKGGGARSGRHETGI